MRHVAVRYKSRTKSSAVLRSRSKAKLPRITSLRRQHCRRQYKLLLRVSYEVKRTSPPLVTVLMIEERTVANDRRANSSTTCLIRTFVRHHLPQPRNFDPRNHIDFKWCRTRNNTVTSLRVDRSIRSLVNAERPEEKCQGDVH